MAKTYPNGRSKTSSYVMITRFMLRHESWLELDPRARCIYIELRALYNGNNNGHIWLSCRDAAQSGKCSKSTASRMFTQLIVHGYIKANDRGHFGNKHATTWILTNESYGNAGPTNEWAKWKRQSPV